MADEPVWSPEDHLDRVYVRARRLRRRRAMLLRGIPAVAAVTVITVVALIAAGGPEPSRQHLRVADEPGGRDATSSTTVIETSSTVNGGSGSVAGPTSTRPGPGTTAARVTTTLRPGSTTPTTVGRTGSGVSGTVMFGPQCPVERADQPCPDRPGPADVTLRRENGSVAGTAHAGDDGRFSIAAPPGQYTVSATSGSSMGGCQDTSATVTAGHYTDVTVSCDTGIR